MNFRPGDFGDWMANGTLYKDGVPVGVLGWEQLPATVNIYMELATGKVVLESHVR